MFFEDETEGFQAFYSDCAKCVNAFVDQSGLRISMKESLLLQVYYCASETARFHNIPPDNLNHFKELAHLSYWTARLKPFRIAPPGENMQILKEWAFMANGPSFDVDSDLSQDDYNARDYQIQESKVASYSDFPLNEWLGLSFCMFNVELAWNMQLEEIRAPKVRQVYVEQTNTLRDRFKFRIHAELAMSLRHHTFSARGLAIALESILDLNTDETTPFT
ncbi:MAG: hypothetical protein CMK09_00870 [Ponticaulis sp.]|nr:hypothetical protein [Ponticaulis sp.]|tara:strand:- start:6108 stop:6767 length:660 start_codon:yes stop_codon:yes gene_type:complete